MWLITVVPKKMIEQLIKVNKPENTWLEYKSYWYWNAGNENIQVGWTEFLKDFSALFNTDVDGVRYFIIGYDEKSANCNNFFLDTHGKSIEILADLESFKKTVVSKLKKHFTNFPVYKKSTNLEEIESFFDVEEVKLLKHRLLVFSIHPTAYLLQLNCDLQGYRQGNIILRKLKSDGTPENVNAPFEDVEKLRNHLQEKCKVSFPSKDHSIEKIVQAYRKKFSPTSTIVSIDSKRDYANGMHFEIFLLQGKQGRTTDTIFVYLPACTSQRKTIEYINSNVPLDENVHKIVLVHERNARGGHTNREKIKEWFCEKYPSSNNVEVWALECFCRDELYKKLFDDQMFHQGNFNISNFVQPYIKGLHTKTADIILTEWFNTSGSPLLIVKGPGGIGKTTLVKHCLDELKKSRESTNILFIDSSEIINNIIKSPKIDNVFDFYSIVAEKNRVLNQFDETQFEISIDNGDLIVVLDGIEEVIAKVGTKFHVNSFIDSIFNTYSDNFENSKILITCRDYFVDTFIEINKNIHTVLLEPFDRSLAEEYFNSRLRNENLIIRKTS